MQVFDIMRMSIRLGIVFGLSGLLSVAITALIVVRLSEFADTLAATPANRTLLDGIRTACAIGARVGAALVACGMLTWWILRVAPFPRTG